MTDLSPAARAIVQAFDERHELLGPLEGNWQEVCLAAAIRTVADQTCRPSRIRAQNDVRYKLLAIADELDAL